MGKVIDLSERRNKAISERPEQVRLQCVPPVIVVQRYRNGKLEGEERALSERILRELLDNM